MDIRPEEDTQCRAITVKRDMPTAYSARRAVCNKCNVVALIFCTIAFLDQSMWSWTRCMAPHAN